MSDWDETKERETTLALSARPAGATWEGFKAERKKQREIREEEKRTKKREKLMGKPQTGAARAWFWIARAHVAATMVGAALIMLCGALSAQSLFALTGESDDAVMIPVASDQVVRSQDAETQLNSMIDMINARSTSFRSDTRWVSISQEKVNGLAPGFGAGLAVCEQDGFCQRFPVPYSKMSLWRRMPISTILTGKPLRVAPPQAAAAQGAADGYVVWGTMSLVFTSLGSLAAGVALLVMACWWSSFGGFSEWSSQSARARWAESFCRWSEEGFPEFERKQMLRAAKEGRLAVGLATVETEKRTAHRL